MENRYLPREWGDNETKKKIEYQNKFYIVHSYETKFKNPRRNGAGDSAFVGADSAQ